MTHFTIMIKKIQIVGFLLIIAGFIGCGHTNELSRYDLNNRKVYFQYRAAADAIDADAFIAGPTAGTTVADIVTAVGSGVASDAAKAKLDRALSPDTLALHLATAIQGTAISMMRMQPEGSMENNPDFIFETTLDNYSVSTDQGSITISVTGTSSLYDRATGECIWEYDASKTISLSESYYSYLFPTELQTAMGAYNAVKLLEMSEPELRKMFAGAAEEAGREMGKELREDYSKSRKDYSSKKR